MSIPFAHGTQKRRIVAALWRSLLFKFGDNPGQVSFAKHAGPYQQLAWLHSFFKIQSCQGLSPNPCCARGHPENHNHDAIWLVRILNHSFWAVQRHTDFSKNDRCTTDGLEGVFAYMDDSRVGSPDRQTHIRQLEAFFTALATNGLAINLEKCVFTTPSLEILGHKNSATGAAPTANHAAEI
jgi:hypothetical protein